MSCEQSLLLLGLNENGENSVYAATSNVSTVILGQMTYDARRDYKRKKFPVNITQAPQYTFSAKKHRPS